MLKYLITMFALAAVVPELAHAYAGPGMGLGLIASVLGVVAAFFMALIALIWFPLKRVFAKRKTAPDHNETVQ